ncbi:unnamed protein product [Acanthoscelides obtectus]|uniref:Uncharacterized protein n=1 Tax=Acanthoscelides obtectus TaxID=200917 RepID=A0A9P0LNB7_ACAOB|nr:unnamed protein product [Acanthoscelides obtectus]CAK1636154.1 hypothetical protein AOBTE_LOCUS9765 [Acanthoscelides obtectus]
MPSSATKICKIYEKAIDILGICKCSLAVKRPECFPNR